jgi:hypothetical protein
MDDDDEDDVQWRNEVAASDFAESLYRWSERNGFIDRRFRSEFIEITTKIIYDAMISTCGFGIKG